MNRKSKADVRSMRTKGFMRVNRKPLGFECPRKPLIIVIAMTLAMQLHGLLVAQSLQIAELPIDREVLYSRDIAPVIQKNCVACHNESDDEGGVNLESPELMLKADAEDVLLPGKPDASRLFIVASHQDDPIMPPEDNDVSASPLKPIELALLRRWIETGAKVDSVSEPAESIKLEPLPASIRTVFGSELTPDGRFAVVSFGNRIQTFAAKSAAPIETLNRVDGDTHLPAHDDFVQDLYLDADGRKIVSAGFRNIKFWSTQPVKAVSLPRFDGGDVIAVAMNQAGTHWAALTPRGELNVGQVGQGRWQWMRGFDLPASSADAAGQEIQLSVSSSGDQVVVALDRTIRLASVRHKEVKMLEIESPLTSMAFIDEQHLVCGDQSGRVLLVDLSQDPFQLQAHDVFDAAVRQVFGQGNSVAVDVDGKISIWDSKASKFAAVGSLPSKPRSIVRSERDEQLWVVLDSGVLGLFDLAEKNFIELAGKDPAVNRRHQDDQWASLVAERLVGAASQEHKNAEADIAAEQKSLETLTTEIETKSKEQGEKQKALDASRSTLKDAMQQLTKAKSTEETENTKREQLVVAIKNFDAEISTIQKRLEELKTQKAASEKQLTAIPAAEKLAAKVKAASEAVSKAEKDSSEKENQLREASNSLESAKQTKMRGEKRLADLKVQAEHRKQALDDVNTEQSRRKDQASKSKSALEKSSASAGDLVALSNANMLTRGSSGSWSLWSAEGVWLCELPEFDHVQQIRAAGHGAMLVKKEGDAYQMWVADPTIWKLQKQIGSVQGESPFADRVLCLDVDSSRQWMATGGGQPSRSGEIILWQYRDGSEMRRIENPHQDSVLCLRFSPDGTKLASGAADRMIKIWDVQSGKLIKTLEGHTHHVTSIDWNASGRQLASSAADGIVKIWDLRTAKSTRTISGLKSEVTRLCYMGRDDRVGITSGDGYFRVYRTDNGRRETNAKLPGGYLYSLAANREGTEFLVGGASGKALLVDKAGKTIAEME